MPFQTRFLPGLIPFFLCARTNEELHFHLFKLAHTEDKLACHDLIAESLTNLGYSKWYLHACRLLHVEEVDKYTLRSFGAQVNSICFFGYRAKLCGEHEIELADICPVAGATDRVNNFIVLNQLL